MMKTKKYPNVKILASPHRFPMSEYSRMGYDVTSPFRGSLFICRLLRYISFRIGLPGRTSWFRRIDFEGINLVIMHEWIYAAEYLKWLRARFPDTRICYLYSNRITSPDEVNAIKALNCEIWSYDSNDSELYDIEFIPTGGYPYSRSGDEPQSGCDVFYIGRDKGRAQKLLEIKATLDSFGLDTEFHITADVFYKRFSQKYYSAPISYDRVVDKVKRSKAILHLIDGAQRGVTLRVSESIVLGVKLITDFAEIADYDFFNPNNIFIIDGKNWHEIPEFLARPYIPVPDYIREKYTADGFIEGLLRGDFSATKH